jgi:preprotein translocase subunit SecA
MAQRDPLIEYQREGFDMFQAMMEGIKEESVGFLFNLEVQVEEPAPTAAASVAAAQEEALPQLDLAKLAPASTGEPDESDGTGNGAHPQIKAKGLDRERTDKPLVYSAPELGSDAPAVQTATASGEKAATGTGSPTARRQQARSNPNRGSRGNKGGANRRKR